jgi:hypothetical protein
LLTQQCLDALDPVALHGVEEECSRQQIVDDVVLLAVTCPRDGGAPVREVAQIGIGPQIRAAASPSRARPTGGVVQRRAIVAGARLHAVDVDPELHD